MFGNVAEWVFDWYDADFYRSAPGVDPVGPLRSPTGGRVLRGGAWNSMPLDLRVSSRRDLNPTFRQEIIGFRCVGTCHGQVLNKQNALFDGRLDAKILARYRSVNALQFNARRTKLFGDRGGDVCRSRHVAVDADGLCVDGNVDAVDGGDRA